MGPWWNHGMPFLWGLWFGSSVTDLAINSQVCALPKVPLVATAWAATFCMQGLLLIKQRLGYSFTTVTEILLYNFLGHSLSLQQRPGYSTPLKQRLDCSFKTLQERLGFLQETVRYSFTAEMGILAGIFHCRRNWNTLWYTPLQQKFEYSLVYSLTAEIGILLYTPLQQIL